MMSEGIEDIYNIPCVFIKRIQKHIKKKLNPFFFSNFQFSNFKIFSRGQRHLGERCGLRLSGVRRMASGGRRSLSNSYSIYRSRLTVGNIFETRVLGSVGVEVLFKLVLAEKTLSATPFRAVHKFACAHKALHTVCMLLLVVSNVVRLSLKSRVAHMAFEALLIRVRRELVN